MNSQPKKSKAQNPSASARTEADSPRQAGWLLSPYEDSVWEIRGSHEGAKASKLNFQYRLADGTCLTQATRLYKAVKGYAWWVRDSRFGRVEDATTHVALVNALMNVAHALTLRNIWSFAHLTPFDIEEITEECRYGVDALLRASERVEKYLKQKKAEFDASTSAVPNLPTYVAPDGRVKARIASSDIIAACNLPANSMKLRRVAWFVGRAAIEQGLQTQYQVRETEPPLSNVSVQNLGRFLDSIESLYVMRARLDGEGIAFRPFTEGAAKRASQLGADTERTPTPPPNLALHLMEHAAEWVVNYAPELLRGLEAVRATTGRSFTWRAPRLDAIGSELPQKGSEGSPWPVVVRSRTFDGSLSFYEALKYLATASWILIATFSARRYEELIDLEDGCLVGSDEDGWWLNIYIEKTLQRKEWIPVPNVVERAGRVMISVSESARRKGGSKKIFQWYSPFSNDRDGLFSSLDPRKVLDDFATHVHVPVHQTKSGERQWHWHPHQLRKFFAILYFYRYDGSRLEVLSHHLRHFNLEMTRRYVTEDPEVAALWTSVEWGYSGSLARSIVSGDRAVSGGMGERLKKTAKRLIDLFRAKLHVADPNRIGSALQMVMQRKGLVITPKPWVACSCPRTQAAAIRARCRAGQESGPSVVGPDFASAGPLICESCPWAITDKARSGYVELEIEYLEGAVAAETRSGTLLGELEELRVIQLRQVKEKRYEGATALGALKGSQSGGCDDQEG